MSEAPGVTQTLELPAETPSQEQTPGPGDATEVECPICYQEYNQCGKCPRMLECQHVFCTECLQQMQLSSPALTPPDPDSSTFFISCPLCRHPTPLRTGDALSLPTNSRILACLPPMAFCVPTSMAARLATTVTQRVVVSLEHHRDARFIILPTVSLRVEQMTEVEEEEEERRRRRANGETNLLVGLNSRQQRRTLLFVQMLAVVFWVIFVLTCVIAVVFGPSLFHLRHPGGK